MILVLKYLIAYVNTDWKIRQKQIPQEKWPEKELIDYY
jgi:hypothetical protein